MPEPVPNAPSLENVIAGALDPVFAILCELPDSLHANELRAQARIYELMLTRCLTARRTNVRGVDVVLDLVAELHKKAAAAKGRMQSEVPRTPRTGTTAVHVAAGAIESAEDGLVGLPLSADVRELQRRVFAVRTVLLRVVRDDAPSLSNEQRGRLADDAVTLAEEVSEVRRRQGIR